MTSLAIEDVTVTYGSGAGRLTAVRNVTLAVAPGETIGIVGESGSGKSTLAQAITGLLVPTSGRITFPDSGGLPPHRCVQLVFQNPYSSLNPRMSVAETLAEAARMGGATRAATSARVDELLASVQLARALRDRFPHQLSGGQRQRVAIARALAVSPRVLVLDEPTSALDVTVQAALLDMLRDLQAERGFAAVFISHDLAVVRQMTQRVAVMYFGRVVEQAETAAIYDQPAHPYTKVLLAAARGERISDDETAHEPPDPRNPPTGCPFHPRCPWGPASGHDREACRDVDPSAVAEHTVHQSLCHFVEPVRSRTNGG